MIKREITKKKSFQTSLALAAIGVLLVLGCPASNNSTGPGPGDRGSDTTAPTITSSVPAADATDFPANSNIILTYSEAVQAGTGSITLTPTMPAGGTTLTIAVGSAQVTITGAVVTIDPSENLGLNTEYTLTIPAGAFMDAAGNKTVELTLSFRTAADLDETAPSFDSSSSVPAADATDINASLNIILTYNEPVQAGTGNITITPSGGAAITIAVGDAQVSFSGAVVTINPTNSLAVSTTYTLTVPAGAIVDASGNAGSEVTLSFSTATNIVPVVISSVPVAGATDFPINSTFTLTFSEAVQVGTGNIEISRAGLITRILVGGGSVSISGAVVTIILPSPITLLENTAYTMSFDAGVFESSTDQTPALAFSLNFSTLDATAPTLSSSVPASGATAAIADRDITLTYSEAVVKGSGNITLTPTMPAGGTTITIAVGSAQVTITGAVVTINPTENLELNTQYTLTIPEGGFTDATGNQVAELTRSFTTAALLAPRVISSVPADGGTLNISGGNSTITLTYNQPMSKGEGNIMLLTSNNRMNMIVVSDDEKVTISGTVVSINISSFSSGRDSSDTNLYVVALTVPVSAFANADGNNPLSEFILTFNEL